MTEIDEQFKNIQVFIYCGGKCGSMTLYRTLSQYFSTGHFHNQETFKVHYNIDNYTLFDIIDYNSKLYNDIYIIDSYRTPIERKMAGFFNNINVICPNYKSEKTENLIKIFNGIYIYGIEEYHPLDEIMSYYDVEPFKTFDFNNKYNITTKNNIHFIKIRFNDTDNWDEILRHIFKKQINILSENLSADKTYSNEYINFKLNYRLPYNYYNQLINDKHFKIYNTDEEQEIYKLKWNEKIEWNEKIQ